MLGLWLYMLGAFFSRRLSPRVSEWITQRLADIQYVARVRGRKRFAENLKLVLPKGTLVPIPLACTVRFGTPLVLAEGEDKLSFLARARTAMLDLRPEYDRLDDKPKAASGSAA